MVKVLYIFSYIVVDKYKLVRVEDATWPRKRKTITDPRGRYYKLYDISEYGRLLSVNAYGECRSLVGVICMMICVLLTNL